MRTVGVVVNPIAGMGGRVGLKGTDGKVAEARERGAEPRAPDRAQTALEALVEEGVPVELLTYEAPMGAGIARDAGFDPTVVGAPADPAATTADDTRGAVAAVLDRGVDLVLFVGGDGTAVDVAEAIASHEADPPMLGVPAGVKVFSEVFAVSPADAGQVAATFDRTEPAEVNDVDEDAYRAGEVTTELRATATVPVADRRQASKQLAGGSVDALAEAVAEAVRPDRSYVLGPGSTVGAVERALGVAPTPLGVDVYRDGELVVRDGGAHDIRGAIGADPVVVVSPIGGQGFLFGRGNQQITPDVVRRADLAVLASRSKLDGLGALHVDTGDPDLDAELRGWIRVRVGPHERRLVEVV